MFARVRRPFLKVLSKVVHTGHVRLSVSPIGSLSACPPSLFRRHVQATEPAPISSSGLATLPVMWARQFSLPGMPGMQGGLVGLNRRRGYRFGMVA